MFQLFLLSYKKLYIMIFTMLICKIQLMLRQSLWTLRMITKFVFWSYDF